MSDRIDNGGPAFPTEPNTQRGFYAHHGMSLRDWFAGQALVEWSGMMVLGKDNDLNISQYEQIAKVCYGLADAMISVRDAALLRASPVPDGNKGEAISPADGEGGA